MADLSALAQVTKFFASGQTRKDCILRRYGASGTTRAGGRTKGNFDADPITLFEDPRSAETRQQGAGADADFDKVLFTLAQTRGEDDLTGHQGDEIVFENGDIYQVQTWTPWRDGPGDEIRVKRVGKVGVAPY